ncbi:MAG: flagellar biosynthesis repressor FlbT [Rhizobiaceae bacterium]|nr:flagellar biosynthesis repressor FlbT [Rhizobiaceae bacterium]
MKVFLKEGEKIYLNGAMVQVDRKVSIKLLNETKFLLQNQFMSAEEADTPLKQLYFAIQLMIINPETTKEATELYRGTFRSILNKQRNPAMVKLLRKVQDLIEAGREHQALKLIRGAFNVHQYVLSSSTDSEDNQIRKRFAQP